MPDRRPLQGVRLLTFDLDDTLIDTDAIAPERVGDAIEAARRLLGVETDYDAAFTAAVEADPVRTGRIEAMFLGLGIDRDHEHAAAIRAAYNRRLIELVRPFPDAEEVLRSLHGRVRVAVLSNGPEALQRAKLEQSGLAPFVDDVIISGVVGIHKPDRRIFLHACDQASVSPSAAAHVGDSLYADISGARAAGMLSIWRRPKHRVELDNDMVPDLVIEELTDLLAWL